MKGCEYAAAESSTLKTHIKSKHSEPKRKSGAGAGAGITSSTSTSLPSITSPPSKSSVAVKRKRVTPVTNPTVAVDAGATI